MVTMSLKYHFLLTTFPAKTFAEDFYWECAHAFKVNDICVSDVMNCQAACQSASLDVSLRSRSLPWRRLCWERLWSRGKWLQLNALLQVSCLWFCTFEPYSGCLTLPRILEIYWKFAEYPGNCVTVFDYLWLMWLSILVYERCSTFVYRRPRRAGSPPFSPCPFTSSSFALFLLFPFLGGFNYFLLLSIPFLSTRIVPHRFQAGGRRSNRTWV